MKCIYCSNDAKFQERADGKCPRCKHAFAFEPKTGDKVTDAAFKAALDAVSAGGKVRFGEDHLYYELSRRLARQARKTSLVFAVIAGVTLIVGTLCALVGAHQGAAVGLVGGTLALAVVVATRLRKTPRLSRAEFASLPLKWSQTHGAPPGLIVRKALPATSEPRVLPKDIAAYSFDRAVVTDRPETVDLLLSNNFHFENNCAVLSIDGYPAHAFETVRAMLRKNPRLIVYALHDCTAAGCLLAKGLATDPDWFQGTGARIVDVGLRPHHARSFAGLWLESAPLPSALVDLEGAEHAWLSRWILELAAVRPEQVIKRLFKGISTAAEPEAMIRDEGGDDLLVLDLDSFASDASASDGGGDSFG